MTKETYESIINLDTTKIDNVKLSINDEFECFFYKNALKDRECIFSVPVEDTNSPGTSCRADVAVKDIRSSKEYYGAIVALYNPDLKRCPYSMVLMLKEDRDQGWSRLLTIVKIEAKNFL